MANNAKARQRLGITVEGPFFQKDPKATVGKNAHDFMQKIAKAGETDARTRAASAPRQSKSAPYSAPRITGRVQSLTGKRWVVTAVISANTSGLSREQAQRVLAALSGRHTGKAKSGRNLGTTPGLEGLAKVFSGTAADLRRLMGEVDLTKGL
jgi:hypothetical protein